MNRNALKTAALLMALLCLSAVLMPAALAEENAAIHGLVFMDSNGNGIADEGENAVEGAELTLVAVTGGDERIANQAKSDASGQYTFSGLGAGDYYLQAILPGNLVFTVPASGGSAFLPSQGQDSRTTVFSLTASEQLEKPLGAAKDSGYIQLTAFGDLNMNGGRMSNEPLIRDVLVDVLFEMDGESHIIAQGKTDRDGLLSIRELTQTTYRIAVAMPEPYIVGPLGQKMNPFYNVINPGDNNHGVSEPFTLERSIGLGIGGVKAGRLEGSIWFDSDMDGNFAAGEGGHAGIKLTLTHLGLGITRELVTGQEADFSFEYLQAGEYSIRAELPDSLMFALPGSPSIFTDGYAATQEMKVQVLEDGTAKLQPIGVMPASSVTVVAFHDSNVDGLPQEGEPPFTGAMVEIIKDGKVLASALADGQGKAALKQVRQGEVTIKATLPDGQVFTIAGSENGNAFSSISASSSIEITRPLGAGEHLSLFAGSTLPAAFSGTLFEDSNQNGVMDNGEAGLEGFTVQAFDLGGNIASETVTGADGVYVLEGLVPSEYRVRFKLLSPYIFSAPSNLGQGKENKVTEQTRAYGQTPGLLLLPGMVMDTVDAGAFRSAVVNGSVLLGDVPGGFEGNRGGLEGVYVELLDENGQEVSDYTNATTDSQGNFSLKGALPGTYSLSFRLPENAKFSRPHTDEKLIQSARLTLKASDQVQLEPLFAVQTAVISGQAFYDANLNGVFDQDETAVPMAELSLSNANTGETYAGASDESGKYTLSGIRPGQYTLGIKAPEGYMLDANERALVPPSVSGVSEKTMDIPMGGRYGNSVIALVKPAAISGTVFYDTAMNGVFDPDTDTPRALAFTLTHLNTQAAFKLDANQQGQFASEGIFPGKYTVSLELPVDHLLIAPENAAQDARDWRFGLNVSEGQNALELALVQLGSLSGSVWNMDGSGADVSGLAVKLLDAKGDVAAQTLTDGQGAYRFENLLPVTYTLEASLPETYRFARQVDTADRISLILSDIVGSDKNRGQSGAVSLGMGEHKTAQDIGMGAMGTLGDFAWLDVDRDGMQDAGEPGIPGLTIQLYQYGQLSAQTTTDAYGRYLFTGLFPGTYSLKVAMPKEIKPTKQQDEFRLVASVLLPTEETTATAEGLVVPSGRRNLNVDLGFVLRKDGQYPASLLELPVKDWTRVNEQQPKR